MLALAKLIWAALRANPRLVVAGLIVAGVMGFGFYERHQGAESIRKANHKAEARAVAKATKTTADLASSARKAGDDASATRERIVYRTKIITERVPYEIPRPGDVRLPAGFLRLYNASLGLPEDPRPAGQPADTAGGLYSADALVQAIVPNNGACAWYAENYPRVVKLYDEAREKVNGFKP